MKIGLTHNQLKAALLFAANKDVRYYLNGVLFNGETGELVATDGHRIIVVKTSWRGESKCIIPRGLIEKALKITKADEVIELEYDEAHKLITLHGLFDSAIDGKYPDYSHALPDNKDLVRSPAAYNVQYLADAHKAHNILLGLKPSAVCALVFQTRRPANSKDWNYDDVVNAIQHQSAAVFHNEYTICIMPLRT